MKINNIIFDFGGVVLKHRNSIMEEFVAKMFNLSMAEADRIWQFYKPKLITGKISSNDFLKELKIKLKSKKSLAGLMSTWKELYKKEADKVNWPLLDLIQKLKLKYKVYLFTDTLDIHDEYNRKRDIYKKFNRVFKSFEEGTIKTNKKAFLNVLHKIKARADECLYIDDIKPNIGIAESLGITSILFKNNRQLINKFNNILNK